MDTKRIDTYGRYSFDLNVERLDTLAIPRVSAATEKMAIRGLNVNLLQEEKAKVSEIVRGHLERDEQMANTLSVYKQLVSRKYAAPLPSELQRRELAAIDGILISSPPQQSVGYGTNRLRVLRGPIGAARHFKATADAGVGYFCFPFVAVMLFLRLVRARRTIQRRRDDALCCIIQNRLSAQLLKSTFSVWEKALRSDRWSQQRIKKNIFRAWANTIVVQKWSRNAAGQKLERVIMRQYRLKRIFDVWRLTTWVAKYLDGHWLTIRNANYDPSEADTDSAPMPFIPVTTLRRESMDTIENSTAVSFADRYGRDAKGRPLVSQNQVQVSSSVANVLPEAVRFVWELVFARQTAAAVTEYTLLQADGSVGFSGRVTKELSAANRASKLRFQKLVPPVWGRWRHYVKASKKMKSVSTLGDKYFITTTRVRILKQCVKQWHDSQLVAFAVTNFAVKAKYTVLQEWRHKVVEKRRSSELTRIADERYRSTTTKRLMAQWKDSMRGRVVMQVLGTMQALLHRREMLYVIHTWQGHYYKARSADRTDIVRDRSAFAAQQRTNERSDMLRITSNSGLVISPLQPQNPNGLVGDGTYEAELASFSSVSALQIKAFGAWRKYAQDCQRYRTFTDQHVEVYGKLLAMRAWYVWRCRGEISWVTLETASSPPTASSDPLSTPGAEVHPDPTRPIGHMSFAELNVQYVRKLTYLSSVRMGGANAPESGGDSFATMPQKSNATPLTPGLGGSQTPNSSHFLGGTTSSLSHQTVPHPPLTTERIANCRPALSLYAAFQWPAARMAVLQFLAAMYPADSSSSPKGIAPMVSFSESLGSPNSRSFRSPAGGGLDTQNLSSTKRSAQQASSPAHTSFTDMDAMRQQLATSHSLPTVGVASVNIVSFGCVPCVTSGVARLSALFPPLDSRFIAQFGVGGTYEATHGSRRDPQTPMMPQRSIRVGKSFNLANTNNNLTGSFAGSVGSQRFQHSPVTSSLHPQDDSDLFLNTAMGVVQHLLTAGAGVRGDLLLLKARLLAAQYKAYLRYTDRSLGSEEATEVLNPTTSGSFISRMSVRLYNEEIDGVTFRHAPRADESKLTDVSHTSPRRSLAPNSAIANTPASTATIGVLSPTFSSVASPMMGSRTKSVTIMPTPTKTRPSATLTPVSRTLSPRPPSISIASPNSDSLAASPGPRMLQSPMHHTPSFLHVDDGSEASPRRSRSESASIFSPSKSKSALVTTGKATEEIEARRGRRGVFSRYIQQRIGFAFVVMGMAVQAARKKRTTSTLVYGNRHKANVSIVRPWWESLGLKVFEVNTNVVGPHRLRLATVEIKSTDDAEPNELLGADAATRTIVTAYSVATALENELLGTMLTEQARQTESRRNRRQWLFGGGSRAELVACQATQSAQTEFFVGAAPRLIGHVAGILRAYLLESSKHEAADEGRTKALLLSRYPEFRDLYTSTEANASSPQQTRKSLHRNTVVLDQSKLATRAVAMLVRQIEDGIADSRSLVWKPLLAPIIQYFERNYKMILKHHPVLLAATEKERHVWAASLQRRLIAIKEAATPSSNEYFSFSGPPLPSLTHPKPPIPEEGKAVGSHLYSQYFRDLASGLLVAEFVQALSVTKANKSAASSSAKPPQADGSVTPSAGALDITAAPVVSDQTKPTHSRSVILLVEALNSLIHYNRSLSIRTRMRHTFLLRRYKAAAAATHYIQTLVFGAGEGPNPPPATRKFIVAPPTTTSDALATYSEGVDATAIPHYTPFDSLTGNKFAPTNPRKMAWSTESNQFRRTQSTQYHHYTMKTVRQAEQQQREEEAHYAKLLREAQQAAKEEEHIANATGSVAARLRLKGRKSRVGGAVMGNGALPFLNTLIEKHRPGSAPLRVVSDKLAYGLEDSENEGSEGDDGTPPIPTFAVVAPTLPQPKVRKLMMVKKGMAQGLGDPSQDLEELKKTNPRLYYHQVYAAKSQGSVASQRKSLMDMFTEGNRTKRAKVRVIGLIGQHVALELAIKIRLKLENRMFEKRASKVLTDPYGNRDTRHPKQLVVKARDDEDDTRGADEAPTDRYPFTAANISFLFLEK